MDKTRTRRPCGSHSSRTCTIKPQRVVNGVAQFVEVAKGAGADNLARQSVGDAQDKMPPALVGQGHAVLEKLMLLEAALGLLELDPLRFPAITASGPGQG
jgi:hypothetical protein